MTEGPGIQEVVETYTLPRQAGPAPDDKKRTALIYAEALRRALRQPGGGRA